MKRGLVRMAAAWSFLGLLLLSAGCGVFGPSEAKLVRVARNAPEAHRRREALARLRGRQRSWMRADLEGVLRSEVDPAGRAIAAEMLGELGADAGTVAELRETARRDVQWVVREAAIVALGRILGAEVAEDLAYALANDAEPQVRAAALEVADDHLAGSARDRLIELLDLALLDDSTLVRLRASRLLSHVTGLSAPPDAESWRRVRQGP